ELSARARRVRPPEPFKDWTEARQGGVDLSRWWREILAGIERPRLFSWEKLSTQRWGPALTDAITGIAKPGRPFDPETFRAAMDPANDPYVLAERVEIQWETRSALWRYDEPPPT